MNILHITKYFYPATSFGGPIQCTYNLTKFLVKRGHKVTVYATDALNINTDDRIKEKRYIFEGVEVFYFRNVLKSFGFFISPSMIRSLKENIDNFDVIHIHEYRTFQNLIFHYINKKRIPYVLSCHGEFSYIPYHGEFFYRKESWVLSFLRRFYEYVIGRKLVENASKLLALTKFEASQYLASHIDKSKIAIIPNGVSVEDFSEVDQIDSFRKSNGIDQEKIILYLGRLHKEKGIDFLMRAFALISFERSDVKLVLAGPDDGFLVPLRKLAIELNVTNKIVFTGDLNRKQVLLAYRNATVVVYVSVQEGFGLVPLEAALVGKPVIVSNAPAMDYVKKGKFGLAIDYGNVDKLKKALEKILNNLDLSREFGENGRRFVTKNYDWETIGKRLEDLYYTISK